MVLSKYSYLLLFLLISLSSCKYSQIDEIYVKKLEKENYIHKITTRGTVEAVNTHNISCPAGIYRGTIQYLIPEGTYVQKGDTVVVIESRETVNDYEQAFKQLEIASSEYKQTKAQLQIDSTRLETNIESIEKSVLITNLDSALLRFTSPKEKEVLQLQIEKAAIEKQRLMEKLRLLEKINKNELRKKEIMIRKMESRLSQAKKRMEKLVLTTEVPGIVLHHENYRTRTKIKEGDPVWRKTPIIQIPDVAKYQVKIMASESDYKKIKRKQAVRIYTDAYPNLELSGEIKHIAPVGIPIEKNSPIKKFEVIASIDSSNLPIEPGISADCDIVIRQIEDKLVIPMISIFNEDSIRYVYKKENKTFMKQPVTIAYYNKLEAVVEKGLQPNDIITLQKPPASFIKPVRIKKTGLYE